MTDYTPIDCAIYARYELAILQHRRLRLGWRSLDGMMHIDAVKPLDLKTSRGEEFLLFLDSSGNERRVRLDRIVESEELGDSVRLRGRIRHHPGAH